MSHKYRPRAGLRSVSIRQPGFSGAGSFVREHMDLRYSVVCVLA